MTADTDARTSLTIEQADLVARKLSEGRLHILAEAGGAVLFHAEQALKVQLSSYQITEHEIACLVAQYDPWTDQKW